jgi:Mn2+/Fe2+ NRAMP family transporter
MRMQECFLLLALGLAIWVLGTVYYGYAGHRILETTATRYWVSFAVSPIVSAVLCLLILKWRHIAPVNWAVAMLLLAIPGMVGEAVVLANLSRFMPRIQEASGGRYGAFLFATYAVVLGVAEIVSLRAGR